MSNSLERVKSGVPQVEVEHDESRMPWWRGKLVECVKPS